MSIEVPARMAKLPRNKAGYVVPWFVAEINGEPDFRVVRVDGCADAVRFELCWLCGQHLGRWSAFVIGPMCSVNRVSAEPPSHIECAEYAVQVCPFLSRPSMRRRDNGKPVEAEKPAGVMIERNPGVTVLWVTHGGWSPVRAPGGTLFDVGDPERVSWWAHGREATRDEVLASIDSGLPILRGEAEREGPGALRELAGMHERALQLVPA